MKKNKAPKAGDNPDIMRQICFRIESKQKKRLDRLGHIEKRKLPGIFRLSLNNALDVWEKTHPRPDGRKLKIVP